MAAASSGRVGTGNLARPSRAKLGYITAAILCAAIAAGGLYYRSHQTKPLTDKDTIVLADFDNKTDDPVLDDTLKQALAVDLDQSPYLTFAYRAKTLTVVTRGRHSCITSRRRRESGPTEAATPAA